jgi:hypothetical protein
MEDDMQGERDGQAETARQGDQAGEAGNQNR